MLQNVWVYKNNRNDNHEIAQKPKELTKVRDHVYFFTEDTDYGTWTHTDFFLVMENKGVFVLVNLLAEKTIREEVTWEAYLQQVENIIEGQRYFNELDLKLLETVSPQLWQRAKASREADIRRREEETQKRLAREKEEQERKEAEKKARIEETERICASLKGILKDNLTPLQKSLAASYLMEVGNFGHNRAKIIRGSLVGRKAASLWRRTIDSLRHFATFPKNSMKIWWYMVETGFKVVSGE